jgi:hypothetical protein
MPDTETVGIPLSGINPDLQLSLNSGKLTHYRPGAVCLDIARAGYSPLLTCGEPAGLESAGGEPTRAELVDGVEPDEEAEPVAGFEAGQRPPEKGDSDESPRRSHTPGILAMTHQPIHSLFLS